MADDEKGNSADGRASLLKKNRSVISRNEGGRSQEDSDGEG